MYVHILLSAERNHKRGTSIACDVHVISWRSNAVCCPRHCDTEIHLKLRTSFKLFKFYKCNKSLNQKNIPKQGLDNEYSILYILKFDYLLALLT